MIENILFNSVQSLLNLADNTAKTLRRIGVETVRDLLFYLPNSYQIKNIVPNLSNLIHGELIQTNIAIVEIIVGNGRKPTKILASNDSGDIVLVFFNKIPPFIFNTLSIGSKHLICGKVQIFDSMPQIVHPEFILRKELESSLEPIYPLTYALTNKQLYYYICKTIELLEFAIATPVGHVGGVTNDAHNYNAKILGYLAPVLEELKILHLYQFKLPPNEILPAWQKARIRLAEFELIANQASLQIIRSLRSTNKGHIFQKATDLQQKILANLGFELTQSQKEVIAEIEQDQGAPTQMMRLLQGDVGSGKTLVALLTIINACKSGFQTTIMAPTDLLANQHYEFFKRACGHECSVGLLTGKTSAKDRKTLAQKLELGEIQILIGTHALFQQNVIFKNLAYIVIDEQHKFGVEQRLKLINKGLHPDILVMSATPIPRSLALTMFGDMEISSLKLKPKNRLPIITTVTSTNQIDNIITALERKISANERIYWVCPLIESKDENENYNNSLMLDVLTRFEILNAAYPGLVGLLHGKMKPDEKDSMMDKFKNGSIQILVATTVIEVGIDVPAATLIIIENAQNFGLAQLHQLRGRVGRGTLQSYCILIYNPRLFSLVAKNRLEVMRKSSDGFYIAEQDMKLRGTGEILGAKQSGEPQLFFANLSEDLEILNKANKYTNEHTKHLSQDSFTHFQIKLFAKKYIDLNNIQKHNN